MKRFNQITLFAGAAALLLASCGKPAEQPAAEKPAINMEQLTAEIQAMEDAYAAAEKAKDADGVVVYYADDAVSFNRSEEPTKGKAAIRERIAERMAKDTTNMTNVYKVVDLYAEGDMAVETGSWSEQDSTGTEVNKGYYMSYFQKRDGKYVCVRDMNVKITADKPAK